MKKGRCLYLAVCVTALSAVLFASFSSAAPEIKISVFNFDAKNLEAAGYNTTVTNLLISGLSADTGFFVLDRKELEAFLNLNDLQQSDNVDNAIHIGSRLGLNAVIIGNVEKKGPVIVVNCKVVSIDKKRAILSTQTRAFGDAGLSDEIRKLHTLIVSALKKEEPKGEEASEAPAPVNIQKRSGNKSVYLSWEDYPGTKSVRYEIFRSTSEMGPFTKIAEVRIPEYLDRGLERNTIYFYKLRAINTKGMRSNFTPVISAETALTPNPPIILKAESRVKSIRLTWTPNPMASEDPLKLVGYKIYRAKTEEGPYREVANILGTSLGLGDSTTLDKIFKLNYTDKGLVDGEDYYYKITAYNEKNLESEFSTPIKGTSIPIVSQVRIKGEMVREIHLSWKSIDSPLIKGYYIYRSTSPSGSYVKIKKINIIGTEAPKVMQYIDTEGLGDNTRYYYQVTAYDEDDLETSPSATVFATTKGKPPVPTGLKAKSGLVKMVEISWNPSTDSDVKGYNLYWSLTKKGKYELLKRINDPTVNSYVHGGGFNKLQDNTTYYYFITSFNKVEVESDQSEAVSATTKPRPVAPSGLKGESLKVKSVPLTWNPNPEPDIEKYHIYRAEEGEKDFSRIASIKGKTNFVDTGLKDGQVYKYRLQAEDKDELLSDLSESITVKTKPRPQKPGKIQGTIRQGKVHLSWTPSPETDIEHYIVYEKKFFGSEKIGEVTAPLFSEAAPPKGKSKTYVITAKDRDGLESEPSEEITIVNK